MPGVKHPDDGMVYACPECDGTSQVVRRVRMDIADGDEEYACHDCGARFDAPEEREARAVSPDHNPDNHAGGKPAKYEAKLLEMDADDIAAAGGKS